MAETKTEEQRMAEFSNGLDSLRPEGFDESKFNEVKEALIKFHEEDVRGLKINTAKAIKEKNDMSAELQTLQNAVTESTAKIEELNKQLQASQPEEQKKFFENQIAQTKMAYEKTINDLTADVSKLSAKNTELEKGVLERDVMADFNAAAASKNWIGGGREAAQRLILTGIEFTRLNMPDGTVALINKANSKDIKTLVDDFCGSELGKTLLRSGNSGGGADGSTSNTGTKGKITKAQYEALSPQEQMDAVLNGQY